MDKYFFNQGRWAEEQSYCSNNTSELIDTNPVCVVDFPIVAVLLNAQLLP
jgi:hypothetical protein